MAGTQVATQEDQEAAVAAEEAYAVETQIKAAMADGRDALWRLAEALYAFDEMRGWIRLGHENLSSWLADTDVTLTRGTYYRLVGSWRKLVIERKVEPERIRQLDQSKVAIVVDQIAAGKATVDDAFADVEALGASDLREKYLGPKPAKPAKTPEATSGHTEEGEVEDEPAAAAGDEPVKGEVEDEPAAAAEDEPAEEPQPADDPEFMPLDEAEQEFDRTIPPSSETTSPAAQALVEADELPWDELKVAFASGVPNPRISRAVIIAFLTWHETHLG